MTNQTTADVNNKISVTFDSNVIEEVVDTTKCPGTAERRIYQALHQGVIQGFVPRTYFVHDAIKREDRMKALTEGFELWLNPIPNFNQQVAQSKVVQTSTIEPDSFHMGTIECMRKLKLEVLAIKRKFWPEVGIELPIKNVPVSYDDRAKRIRDFIEGELHCGFYRFREFLKNTVGKDGDDLALLFQLKEIKYSKKAFNDAFAEAGDGDALISHYGYGIDFFCTNDRAKKAGEQSVFSEFNRSNLEQKFGVKIVSTTQLSELL